MSTVSEYHQRTKHSLQGYAKGPETLDWDDQPDPFRRFTGCPSYTLPKPGKELDISWFELDQKHTIPAQLSIENIGLLLELAFGLSAWKQFGPDRWAVRCNPSSGNLHPTEVYLINGSPKLLPQGVYHYVSEHHQLEQRYHFDSEVLQQSVLIGFSAIHWREAWKYGERAYRYCQLDAGHALAALSYAASALGWQVELLSAYADLEIATVLGLNGADDFVSGEPETADMMCRIHYNASAENVVDSELERSALLASMQQHAWQGKAQSLGAYHMYHWSLIDEVSEAAKKPSCPDSHWQAQAAVTIESTSTILASRLFRQRRSAQHFNAQAAHISQQTFFRLLAAILPCKKPPFDSWNWAPAVHICLFVHKVEGLPSGLYCLPRSEQAIDILHQQLDAAFKWQAVPAFPALYLLHEGDLRTVAKTLSCHQAIAADSAFSLAMLAEFRELVNAQSWYYRRLFWECGLIGQILYLEAEAAGLRGTGIGCFFDDDVHAVLGIKADDTLQSLYHFTVGEALEDSRIQTFPAYAHLETRVE